MEVLLDEVAAFKSHTLDKVNVLLFFCGVLAKERNDLKLRCGELESKLAKSYEVRKNKVLKLEAENDELKDQLEVAKLTGSANPDEMKELMSHKAAAADLRKKHESLHSSFRKLEAEMAALRKEQKFDKKLWEGDRAKFVKLAEAASAKEKEQDLKISELIKENAVKSACMKAMGEAADEFERVAEKSVSFIESMALGKKLSVEQVKALRAAVKNYVAKNKSGFSFNLGSYMNFVCLMLCQHDVCMEDVHQKYEKLIRSILSSYAPDTNVVVERPPELGMLPDDIPDCKDVPDDFFVQFTDAA